MRKIKIVCVLMVMSVIEIMIFTSCLNSVQLNESSIVQAIGIDYKDENEGVFQLTLQIFNPTGAGASTQIDASKNNCAILTTEGKTLDEAMKKADTIQGKQVFTGHNRIIVLGEDFAKAGIDRMFSYFDGNALTRQNVSILVSEGNAKDILSTNIDQSILSAEVIEMMAKNSEDSGFILQTSYHTVSKNMYLYNGCTAIPIISETKESKQEKEKSGEKDAESSSPDIPSMSKLELKSTAIFSKYSMVGKLDEDESKTLIFLSDKLKSSSMIADENDYKATINIYKNATTVTPKVVGKSFDFKFDIKSEGSADEIILPYGISTSEDLIDLLEQNLSNKLQTQCLSVLNKLVKEYKSDVLYLNERILNVNPKIADSLGVDFYEDIDKINFSCNVDLTIDRTGLSVEP